MRTDRGGTAGGTGRRPRREATSREWGARALRSCRRGAVGGGHVGEIDDVNVTGAAAGGRVVLVEPDGLVRVQETADQNCQRARTGERQVDAPGVLLIAESIDLVGDVVNDLFDLAVVPDFGGQVQLAVVG